MNLYLAAVHANQMGQGQSIWQKCQEAQGPHARHINEVRHILESYHYFNNDKLAASARDGHKRLFLDSGAFSAWTQGVQIDLPTYCRFIQDNSDIVEIASVLDAIGDPAATLQNQQAMERLGVKPLPCFHFQEPDQYGNFYAFNYEYITLGGMVGRGNTALEQWLDYVWEKILTDPSGRPRCKVHGFGMTSPKLMARYPWHSVDSSSWVQCANMGGVFDPKYGVVSVSGAHSKRKELGQHFSNVADIEREALTQRFAEVGYTVEELEESYVARRTYCMHGYTDLGLRITCERFINDKMGLF